MDLSQQVAPANKKTCCLRTIYKPHSVRSAETPLCDHLSGRHVTVPLGAAYPELFEDEQSPVVRRRLCPCLALLPTGVTWPPTLLWMPVVSYTTFSPSPRRKRRGCLFLWPYSGRFPRPGCYPTSCSLECGLSSIPNVQDRDRPTDLRQKG